MVWRQVVAPDGRREVILCCAPSDEAVDRLASVMATLPTLRTVRVYARRMEALDTIAIPLGEWSPLLGEEPRDDNAAAGWEEERQEAAGPGGVDQSVRGVALHTLVRSSASQSDEINEIEEFYALTGELPEPEVFAHYEKLLHSAEAQILNAADVVCCTCIESATPRLQQAITVSLCVVDEIHTATEPELLLPLSRAKQALLLEAEGGLRGSEGPAFAQRHAQRVLHLRGTY